MEISYCLDCHVQVGGEQHRSLPGFQTFGYALIHQPSQCKILQYLPVVVSG